MFCPKCGLQQPDSSRFCPRCGEDLNGKREKLEEISKGAIPMPKITLDTKEAILRPRPGKHAPETEPEISTPPPKQPEPIQQVPIQQVPVQQPQMIQQPIIQPQPVIVQHVMQQPLPQSPMYAAGNQALAFAPPPSNYYAAAPYDWPSATAPAPRVVKTISKRRPLPLLVMRRIFCTLTLLASLGIGALAWLANKEELAACIQYARMPRFDMGIALTVVLIVVLGILQSLMGMGTLYSKGTLQTAFVISTICAVLGLINMPGGWTVRLTIFVLYAATGLLEAGATIGKVKFNIKKITQSPSLGK